MAYPFAGVFRLLCIFLVGFNVITTVSSLPLEHVLVDSGGYANIAFRSRDGQVFLIRYNDFYFSFRTGRYDNTTTDAVHAELEPGQTEAPPAYSDPRVFELQRQKRLFIAYVSQDLRITLFEKSNETKKWRFTESDRINVVGSIAGFGDAEGLIHVLHRQSGNAMQELLFDPQTYEWLATSTIPFPDQVTTDFHLCQRGLEYFTVIQTGGKLYLSTHQGDNGWGVFRAIPTTRSLRGSPYCFEGQKGDLVIVVTEDSGRVLVLKEEAKRKSQLVSTFQQEVLQEVSADSGLAAGDAMGYRGLNGSEHVLYRGGRAQVFLASFHANNTWSKTLDVRSLGCGCFNRPTNDPFGFVTVQGGRIPAPAFGDLDGDGDMDFVLGSGALTVEWYENIGNSSHPVFKNRGPKYFEVHGQGVSPFQDSPYFMGYDPFPSLVDLNGDGLLDLVVATRRARDLNVYFNRGNATTPVFHRAYGVFPKVVATNLRATFYDWDNDGDYDAVLSTRYDGIIALENIGNRTHPRFAAYSEVDDPLQDILTTSRLTAELHDFNQDGLVDIIVSQKIAGDFRRLFLWLNVGSATSPKFEATDPSQGPLYGLDIIADSADAFKFVNLHGRGYDLVVSDAQGGLTMLSSQPKVTQNLALLLGPANPFDVIETPFARSAPSLVDIDGDGDLDMFLGDEKAVVSFYRNEGHRGKPLFVRVDGPENPLHGVLASGLEELALSFVDIDGDGDMDCYVNTRKAKLVTIYNNEFPLLKNEGNLTHPHFRQADREENPLANIVRGGNGFSRYRSYFVDLNGDGLKDMILGGADNGQSVALGGEGVRYFKNTGSGFEEQLGKNNPFGHISDIGRFSSFACFDWDLDTDIDCLVVSWGERSFFLLNEGKPTSPVFVVADNGPLEGFKEAISAENLGFADIDDDGLIDVISGSHAGKVVYFRNTGLDCYSDCLGRGFCGAIPVSQVPDESPILAAVASFQGVQTHGEAVGKCWCTSRFRGLSCEMCSEEYYGSECDLSCPKFSRNNVKVVYPDVSTIEDCQCLPTFHKVLQNDGLGFDCVCPPGHEFIQELGVCQQCGAGRFHPEYDLTPCMSCADLFGPRSTTVTSTGTSSGACVCETTFGMYNGQCVCARDHYGDFNASFCTKCPETLPFTIAPGTETRDACLAGPGNFRLEKGQVVSCNSTEFKGKVDCSEKGISLSSLPLRNGFWRLTQSSTQILPCSPLERCVPVQNESFPSEHWWSDVYCTPGHTGVLCEDCRGGLSRSVDGCVSCTPDKMQYDQAIGGLWIFLACVVVLLPACRVCFVAQRKKTRSNKRMRRKQSSTSTQKIRKAVGGCTWAYNAWKVRATLLIGFFQVYVQFVTITGLIDNGSAGITFLQTFAQFDLSALYLAFDAPCLLPVHFVFQLLVYTLLPLISIMLMLSILCYKRSVEVFGSIMYLTLLILFFVYPGVSSLVFQSFVWNDFYHSPQDSSPLQALAADLTILAGSSEATFTTIYGLVMVFLYPVGVVLLFYAAIRFYTTHSSSSSEFYARLAKSVAFLVDSYTVPWYECYELLRKLILTSGYLLVYTASSEGGILFYLILETIFLYVNRVIGGYRSATDFRFAEICHVLLWSLGILPLIASFDTQSASNLAIAIPVIEIVLFIFSGYMPKLVLPGPRSPANVKDGKAATEGQSDGEAGSFVDNSKMEKVEKAAGQFKEPMPHGTIGGVSSKRENAFGGNFREEASSRGPELSSPIGQNAFEGHTEEEAVTFH